MANLSEMLPKDSLDFLKNLRDDIPYAQDAAKSTEVPIASNSAGADMAARQSLYENLFGKMADTQDALAPAAAGKSAAESAQVLAGAPEAAAQAAPDYGSIFGQAADMQNQLAPNLAGKSAAESASAFGELMGKAAQPTADTMVDTLVDGAMNYGGRALGAAGELAGSGAALAAAPLYELLKSTPAGAADEDEQVRSAIQEFQRSHGQPISDAAQAKQASPNGMPSTGFVQAQQDPESQKFADLGNAWGGSVKQRDASGNIVPDLSPEQLDALMKDNASVDPKMMGDSKTPDDALAMLGPPSQSGSAGPAPQAASGAPGAGGKSVGGVGVPAAAQAATGDKPQTVADLLKQVFGSGMDDAAMKQAQSQADYSHLIGTMLKSGNMIAAGLSRGADTAHNEVADDIDKNATSGVSNILTRRDLAMKNLDAALKVTDLNDKQQQQDPNSALSKAMVAMAQQNGIKGITPGMTAETILKTQPFMDTIIKNRQLALYRQSQMDYKHQMDDAKAQSELVSKISTLGSRGVYKNAMEADRLTTNALDLYNKYQADPNAMTIPDAKLFYNELIKISSGGAADQGHFRENFPSTVWTHLQEGLQKISGNPTPANMGAFLQNNAQYLQTIQDHSRALVGDGVNQLMTGFRGRIRDMSGIEAANSKYLSAAGKLSPLPNQVAQKPPSPKDDAEAVRWAQQNLNSPNPKYREYAMRIYRLHSNVAAQ